MEPHDTEAVVFDAATRRLHSRLGATAERFLDYLERHPEASERARYEVLDEDMRGSVQRIQSWPLFVGRGQQARCAEAMESVWQLVRATPHRVFGSDAERLAAFYDFDLSTARTVARFLSDPDHLAPLVARGDFIETEEGFRCVEVNVAGNIGGWAIGLWERHYLRTPVIRSFVRNEGLDLVGVDPVDAFFAHVVGMATSAGLDADGEVNVALAMHPYLGGTGDVLPPFGAERYRTFLESYGSLGGEFRACTYDDLEVVDDHRVEIEGRRVHVLIEAYAGIVPFPLLTAWMRGGVVVLNGPVGRVLNDRRTLALVSEHAESDLFTETERERIRRHVPWTRTVADEIVTFHGRRERLPVLLAEERTRMVLKRTGSMGGKQVLVGATTEPDAWRAEVRDALAEGGWIAQERMLSLPYAFQHGPVGWAPHEVVWGIFAFGDRYGGGFLRMLPQGGSGIVNASRGADDGLYFVVDEP